MSVLGMTKDSQGGHRVYGSNVTLRVGRALGVAHITSAQQAEREGKPLDDFLKNILLIYF